MGVKPVDSNKNANNKNIEFLYPVKVGESLRTIIEKMYFPANEKEFNDVKKEILNLNKNISDPSKIQAGMNLKLPVAKGSSKEQVNYIDLQELDKLQEKIFNKNLHLKIIEMHLMD